MTGRLSSSAYAVRSRAALEGRTFPSRQERLILLDVLSGTWVGAKTW